MNPTHMTPWLMVGVALISCLTHHATAQEQSGSTLGDWKLNPSIMSEEYTSQYTPLIENHFSIEGDVLKAKCALGKDFYAKFKDPSGTRVFLGPGPIWVTNTSWPAVAGDFEFTFECRWNQEEPGVKYGDFPDTHTGFRLSPSGSGYDLSWGMLGQIRLARYDSDGVRYPIGQGQLNMIKNQWTRYRIRAAGPIIKVKIWSASKPEPATWSLEAFDDWSDTAGTEFKSGTLAAGFWGRMLFDTCIYEWRNFQVTLLTPDEVKAEKFFDSASAPKEIGYAGAADVSPVKVPELTEAAKSDGLRADANLDIKNDGANGLVIASKDGEPAFLWKAVANANPLVLRMKSTAGARPLFAVKSGGDSTGIAYMDPVWRDGIVALLHPDKQHTAGAYRFTWKHDTWHDFILLRAHWWKWQILETADQKNRAAFAGGFFRKDGGISELGMGVAGQGTVTISHIATGK